MKTTFNFLIIITLVLLSNIVYSQSVPSYVPTNGLVGWWGFNGNAQDGSGNGNHGTVNGATLTTDRFGNQNKAYDFDDTYIIVNASQSMNFTDSLSINFWYKNNRILGGNYISKHTSASLNSSFVIYNEGIIGCGPVNYLTSIDDQISYVRNLNFCDTVSWHMLSFVFKKPLLKMFIDGSLYDSLNNCGTIKATSNPIVFGGTSISSPPYIESGTKAFLDDIGIWNRALTPQEITNLYNSQLPTQSSLCLPTITTSSPTSVGVDSVVIGGDISNDGGSSIVLRGICYSTSPNPNMGNMRTEDGSGTGSFNTVLRGLNPSTAYFARSYAKNSNGVVVYGNEVSFSTSSITIGSNYAGGIVFYVDGTGQHGLVCAPNDQGSYVWGCDQQFIGGTSSLIGFGLSNTNRINLLCSQNQIASRICADLNLNNYSDWYLPSFNELMEIFWTLQGTNGFSNNFYWSSTEDGQGYAKCMYFSHGSAGSTSNAKFVSQRVRAIRSF